jgi:YidC/Oxa1 family membrane protein insertase
MIVTTYMTSRQMILKTGWAEDPTQKMVQRLMLYGIPVSLLISGFAFPIGVVLYWTTTNLFSLGQQFWVLHKYPPPPMASKAGTTPGKSTPARTPATAKAVAGKENTGRGRALLGGKKKEPVEPPAPAVDGKALAPKVGAKPVRPTGRRTAAKQQAGGKQPGGSNNNQQKSGSNAAKRTSG